MLSELVATAVPFGVTVPDPNVHTAETGSPEQLIVVAALNAFTGVMLTVVAAEVPPLTVAVVGESEIVKSVTVTATALDTDAALNVSPT
jgi:hypothetical protein